MKGCSGDLWNFTEESMLGTMRGIEELGYLSDGGY